MTKGTRFLTAAIPAVLVYLLMLSSVLPVPFVDVDTASLLLPVIPWWLLVCFGSYSLMSLGLGLVRFNDTPDAYELLLSEITQAKNELRDQGVTVD